MQQTIVVAITVLLCGPLGCGAGRPAQRTCEPQGLAPRRVLTLPQMEQVARTLAADCVKGRWRAELVGGQRSPIIRLQPLGDQTRGLFDTGLLDSLLETELVSSGKTQVVAAGATAARIREMRKQEAVHGSDRSVKGEGGESGADCLLSGVVTRGAGTIDVALKLVTVGSNAPVWATTLKIPVDAAALAAATAPRCGP